MVPETRELIEGNGAVVLLRSRIVLVKQTICMTTLFLYGLVSVSFFDCFGELTPTGSGLGHTRIAQRLKERFDLHFFRTLERSFEPMVRRGLVCASAVSSIKLVKKMTRMMGQTT